MALLQCGFQTKSTRAFLHHLRTMLAPIRSWESETDKSFLMVSGNTHEVNSLHGGIKLPRQQLFAQVLGRASQNSDISGPCKELPFTYSPAHKATCRAEGLRVPELAVSQSNLKCHLPVTPDWYNWMGKKKWISMRKIQNLCRYLIVKDREENTLPFFLCGLLTAPFFQRVGYGEWHKKRE